jgi:hypothetical protein
MRELLTRIRLMMMMAVCGGQDYCKTQADAVRELFVWGDVVAGATELLGGELEQERSSSRPRLSTFLHTNSDADGDAIIVNQSIRMTSETTT